MCLSKGNVKDIYDEDVLYLNSVNTNIPVVVSQFVRCNPWEIG